MKKISTVQGFGDEILEGQKLTIGLDLGDRWSFYCVLDEAGKIILEHKVSTTPEAMKQTFGKIPRSLIAMETGLVRLICDFQGYVRLADHSFAAIERLWVLGDSCSAVRLAA